MIDIKYSENQVNINTGNLSNIFIPNQLPLKIEIKSAVSKNIVWTVEMGDNMWATYPKNEIYDVIVKDREGKFITQYYWDVFQHGTIFHKSLWLFCKSLINNGIKPRGLVIGTHDGEFGEWVPIAKNFMSDILLIEGSQEQYQKLEKNYLNKDGISLKFDIVTPNGGSVEFYEGGKGYTNSVVERVIRNWEIEQIHTNRRNSVSINEVIKSYGKIDWLHLDVEGLDAKLILSIEGELPPFIIFEDFNLLELEKKEIYSFLNNLNYNLYSDAGICMATKNFKL